MLLTTEEVKKMALIMIESYPKKSVKDIEHIVSQLQCIPDSIRVDFDEVEECLMVFSSDDKMRNKANDKNCGLVPLVL